MVSLRVGLNLVYLVPGETGGMETYARELIPALLEEAPGIRLTAFLNREAAGTPDGPWREIPFVRIPVRARRRVEWVRGEQQLLPRAAARSGVGLVHSLASTGPIWGAFRRVVTIHDLIYHVHPEAHFGLRSLGMRVLVPLAARRSDRIIVPSISTRNDLEHLLKVPGDKIDVVPEGVRIEGRLQLAGEKEIRRRYELGDRAMVLAVSAKRPHKNLVRLLDALALLPIERRPILVLPGYHTPHEDFLRRHAAAIGVAADSRFLGWVEPEELEGLYRTAAAFVFPSLYEGFGLPVLEAMARGVPVACADRASLPEVAGDAALLFDPEQPRAIAAAIDTLVTDPARAERLRLAGLERVRAFTWAATARATLASYERAAGARSAAAR